MKISQAKDPSLIQEIVELFALVWNQSRKRQTSKTKWAFIDSPSSKVLVMQTDNSEVIAARGGFNWPLEFNNQGLKAYQLHGTCVHPNFRRQGIFSRMNKVFVSQALDEGCHLIFNVSVTASRLGYEKLGWKYLKGFQRLTMVNRPFSIIKKKLFKTENAAYDTDPRLYIENTTISEDFLIERESLFKNLIHTKYSIPFLKWRLGNPEENYKCLESFNCRIIFKIEIKDNLKHLIIGDFFMVDGSYSLFKKSLYSLLKIVSPDLTYTYIFNTHPYYNYYIRAMFFPNIFNYNLNFGVRSLNEFESINFENAKWGMSFLDIDTF